METDLSGRRLTANEFLTTDLRGAVKVTLQGNILGQLLPSEPSTCFLRRPSEGAGAPAVAVDASNRYDRNTTTDTSDVNTISSSSVAGACRSSASGRPLVANWLDHPGLGEVSTLNIGNCVLSHIQGIARLASTLTVLKLGSNPLLEVLPPEIGLLSRLTLLSARECRIHTVPPEIGSLRELRVLSLSFNAIESVPIELGQCRNLRVRFVFPFALQRLPGQIHHQAQVTPRGSSILSLSLSLFNPRMYDG
jgi:Leucine-rich repeat (LRR) protein